MAAKIDGIATLNDLKDDWAIVARVLRLWSITTGDRAKITTSIEMILVDEEGVKIHAAVRKVFVRKFERVLKEGSVYSLRGFSVAVNGGEYRLTRHAYKINIQGNTKAILMSENRVAIPEYEFARFDEILGGLHDSSYLIDIMGVLTGVGNERSIEKNSSTTKMNVIEVENSGVKLTCALWGSYADELTKSLLPKDSEVTTVALFSVKIKEFQGKTSLQNSMHATKIIFNPPFAEATKLKSRFLEGGIPPSQGVVRLTNTCTPALADDFLGLTQRKKIAELKHLMVNMDSCFIILGTIDCIVDPDDWWYLSCKCHRAVYPDSVAYYCNSCDRRVLTVMPRYRLKVKAVDDTGSARFVIFDRPAMTLFKKECSALLNEFEQVEDDSVCPAEISGLVGQEFLFKVEVKDQPSEVFEPNYRVKRLINDGEIIKQFSSTNVINEAVNFGAFVTLTDLPTQDPDNADADQSKDPLADLNPTPLDASCDLGNDGGISNVMHVLLGSSSTTASCSSPTNVTGKNKNMATPSKRMSIDVDEGDKASCSPKLLRTIKIEKP